MPKVTISIPPQAEQVRTARLVATAAARRCGASEDRVDDIRLAVSELLTRSVLRHQAADISTPILVDMTDAREQFSVLVHDASPADQPDVDEGLALSVARALAPESEMWVSAAASHVRLSWPIVAELDAG